MALYLALPALRCAAAISAAANMALFKHIRCIWRHFSWHALASRLLAEGDARMRVTRFGARLAWYIASGVETPAESGMRSGISLLSAAKRR